MSETVPPRLDEHAAALRDLLDDAGGLLLGLDFDGTLAPIVADPDAATVDPARRDAVASIADQNDVSPFLATVEAILDERDGSTGPESGCEGRNG